MSALVVVVATLLGTFLGWAFSGYVAQYFDVVLDEATFPGFDESFATTLASSLGIQVTTFFAAPIIAGLLTVSVGQSAIGRKAGVGEVWSQVGRRTWFLIAFPLLTGLAASVALGLATLLVVAGFAVSEGLGAFLIVVALLAWPVLLVWVGTRTGLVPPALALEGQPFWQTVKRAWLLTRGSFWRLFGIYLLALVAMSFVSGIVAYPASLAASFLLMAGQTFLYHLVQAIGVALSMILTSVFLGCIVALLYIDVRMRREGLDVELAAAASEQPPA